MYEESLENLIQRCLADGVLTDQERDVIRRRAEKCGEDPEEVLVYAEGLLFERNNNKPKTSSKEGVRKTCPNCGEVVSGFQTHCKCGFEFNSRASNSSAQELLRKLEEIDKENAGGLSAFGDVLGFGKGIRLKMTIIRNFPIPNTKEDILEFATLCISNMNASTMQSDPQAAKLADAWAAKARQLQEKANLMMKDDPEAQAVFASIKSQDKKMSWQRHKSIIIPLAIMLGIPILLMVIVFCLGGLGGHNSMPKEKPGVESTVEPAVNEEADLNETAMSEIPAGWDQGYMMSGEYQYCYTEVASGDNSLTINLYKNGLEFLATTSTFIEAGSKVKLKIGSGFSSISAEGTVDEDGQMTVRVDDVKKAKKIATKIKEDNPTIKLSVGDQNCEFNLPAESSKNMLAAFDWVTSRPDGYEF